MWGAKWGSALGCKGKCGGYGEVWGEVGESVLGCRGK